MNKGVVASSVCLVFSACNMVIEPNVDEPESRDAGVLSVFQSDVQALRQDVDAEQRVDASAPDVEIEPALEVLESINISQSEGSISHDVVAIRRASGVVHFAFAEPGEGVSQQHIHTGVLNEEGGVHQAQSDLEGQNAFPRFYESDEALHLVFSSNSGGDQDVYYARDNGFGFGLNLDLTSVYEGGTLNRDTFPVPVESNSGGDVAFVFLSVAGGQTRARLRIQNVQDAQPLGRPSTVYEHEGGSCSHFDAASFEGVTHVVAHCRAGSTNAFVYLNNSSGDWAANEIDIAPAASAVDARLAVAASGVHVVFRSEGVCAGGDLRLCPQIHYTHGDESGVFEAPVTVSNDFDDREFEAIVAVEQDRVAVAYHRFANGETKSDVVVALREGQAPFTTLNITPNTPEERQLSAGALLFESLNIVQVFYEAFVNDSDPLNTEIMSSRVYFP